MLGKGVLVEIVAWMLVEDCIMVVFVVVVERDLQPLVGLFVEFVEFLFECLLPCLAVSTCLILYRNGNRC